MSSWVTIKDVPRDVEEVLQEETAEAQLYAMRSSYHRALIMQQESQSVGDDKWHGAKNRLSDLILQLQALPQLSSPLPSPPSSSSRAEVSTTTAENKSQASFSADCQHILYLSQKNLSRIMSQDQQEDSQREALRIALLAITGMTEIGDHDPGLLLRTAVMANKVGDGWTCRQLLGLPLGGLYSGATQKLYVNVNAGSTDKRASLESCWNSLVSSSSMAMACGTEPRRVSRSIDPSLAMEAIAHSLLRAEGKREGTRGRDLEHGYTILRCLREALYDSNLAEIQSRRQAQRKPHSEICDTHRDENAVLQGDQERTEKAEGEVGVVDLTLNESSEEDAVTGLGKRARSDDHDNGSHKATSTGLGLGNIYLETQTDSAAADLTQEIGTRAGTESSFDGGNRSSEAAADEVEMSGTGKVASRAATRASTRAAVRSSRSHPLSSSVNLVRAGLGDSSGVGALADSAELWEILNEMLSDAGEGTGSGGGKDLPRVGAILERCVNSSGIALRRASELEALQEAKARRKSKSKDKKQHIGNEILKPQDLSSALQSEGLVTAESACLRLLHALYEEGEDTTAALLAFISVVSATVSASLFEGSTSHGINPSPDVDIAEDVSGESVALAVMISWRAIATLANMALDELVASLAAEEQVLLAECCAEGVRLARIADGGASPALVDMCHATLCAIFQLWVDTSPETAVTQSCQVRSAILRTRRLWLLATHLLVDGQRGGDVGSDVLGPLEAAVSECVPMRLLHCTAWATIDVSACQLLRAALLDDGSARSLVRMHAPTNDWLQAALAVLQADIDLIGTTATASRRRAPVEQWLPYLCLRACAALGRWQDWIRLSTRVAAVALPAVLSFLVPGSEGFDSSVYWFVGVLTATANTTPAEPPDCADEEAEEWCSCLDDFVMSLAALSLRSFSQTLPTVYEVACAWLVQGCKGVGMGLRVGLECLGACMADLTLRHTGHDALVQPTAAFALLLTEAGALSLSVVGDELVLGPMARAAFEFGCVWSPGCPLVTLASATVCLHACSALTCTSLQSRIDALVAYHGFACDENLWVADNGRTLKGIAHVLQNIMEGGEEGTSGLSVAFPPRQLSIGQQTELGSMLGEMYWMLYSFPLCYFSYNDGRAEAVKFNSPLDATALAALYRFYRVCVSIGLGHKVDRRASLLMLTRSAPVLSAVKEAPGYAQLTEFIFSTHVACSRSDGATLLAAMKHDLSRREMGPLRDVLASAFFVRAAYLSDSTREFPFPEEAGEQLLALERWQVHAIDMCLSDLTFNPLRTESWGGLYFRLADYHASVCDSLAESCVPSKLPAEWHLLLTPTSAGFDGLRTGSIRDNKAFGMASLMLNPFLAQTLPLESVTGTAWGTSYLRTQEGAQELLTLVAFKNFLWRSQQRVVEAMEASLNMQQTPSKDAEATVASVMLAHGRVLLTVANEFPEASREYRQCHAKALQALQTAKQAGATGCYLLATEARLDWAIRGRPKLPLECLTTLRVAVLKDASIGKSARVCILSDASAVIGDIALKLMNREVNFIDIDGEGEHKGEISIALLQTLVTASSYEHRFSCGESTLPVYIEDDCSTAASLSQKNDLLWLSIINCVANFRECRWKDNHDFRCVYGLAQLIQGLAISSVQPPAWAIAQLTRLDVSELTLDAAFAEIYKLFVKRVPQLVAVWSQGKAVHEWDLELQRTYNFEALRRKDTHLFLSLAESCLHMKPALDLLRDALSLSSKKQTATVRWVVDRAVQCVAGIALHGQHPAQEVPSMLNVVFEVFQATHNRIAVRTLYRLQRGLLRLYCLRSAEAGEEEQVTLADCLSACFSEYGERRSDAPIRFHMGLYDAEATAIQQRQREKTLQEEGEGDVDVEMGVNGGECGAGGDLGGGGLW